MSELKTNKVSPATGTALAVGDSGDTITIPSGATLDISASTLTPPATMPASSGVNLTSLTAANLTGTLPAISGANLTSLTATNLGSGTVPTARLGSGTADATTFLRGDQSYVAVAGSDNTPAFLARLSANQSIANATWTKIAVNTEIFDTDSAYDNSTNYRFTVPSGEAGVYIFYFATTYDSVPTGNYTSTVLYVNGTFESVSPWRSRTAYGYISQLGGTAGQVHVDSSMMNLDVGDYIELWTAHNTGSSKDAENDGTYFGGMKLAGVNE